MATQTSQHVKFNGNNNNNNQDQDPSPRMRAKAQRKRGTGKNQTTTKYEFPRNIKNAEGTNTDSFYYVEMENAQRFCDVTNVQDEEQRGYCERIRTESQTRAHKLQPDLSWEKPFPEPETYDNYNESPKADRSSDNSRHEHEIRISPVGTPYIARHCDATLPKSDTSDGPNPRNGSSSPLLDRVRALPLHSGLLPRHNPSRSALPKRVMDEVLATKRPDIQNALDVMRDGETLLMVEHTRWVTRTVNTECRLNNDCMRVTHIRRRCWMPKMQCGRINDTFDIRDVMMARSGRDGLLRSIETDKPETQCFSIVFKNDAKKTMNFLADSPESAKYWVKGINFLKKRLETLKPRLKQELYLWELFQEADRGGDGLVGYSEILEIFRKSGALTNNENKETLKQNFMNYASQTSHMMDFDQFIDFYRTSELRMELINVFNRYSADLKFLTARELYKFLQESQREYDITEQDCFQIIEDFEMSEEARNKKHISLHGFVSFMKSSHCDIFNKRHDEVYQDMKHPLSHYFIASSHNTYLTGDQLKDPSSTDAYMKALLQGCRCVELDCWDGPDDDPVIFHGYTLTSKIKFKHVIEVIVKYAFETSKYPLILSIENHCSIQQQEKMAEYMQSIVGAELLIEPLLSEEEELHLPSPAALQGKIMLKAKKLPPVAQSIDDVSTASNEDDGDVSDEDEAAELEKMLERIDDRKVHLPGSKIFKKRTSTPRNSASGSSKGSKNSKGKRFLTDTQSSSNQSSTKTQEAQEKKFKLSKRLSDQVVYCKSAKFKGIEHGTKNASFRQISSFTENKAHRLATQNTRGAIDFHVEHLNRTYPGASRTDSSNYDPQPLWNAGFQVVALNYQTKCEKMAAYEAKFRQNGRCGYILKPEFMTARNRDVTDANKELLITVISGSHIPVKSATSATLLHVGISITGDPKDVASKHTTPRQSRGYNPVWGEKISFHLNVPSLAMIWFTVYDEDAQVIGQFILPFTSICKGYRTIHLSDEKGSPIKNAYLFVHVTVKPIP